MDEDREISLPEGMELQVPPSDEQEIAPGAVAPEEEQVDEEALPTQQRAAVILPRLESAASRAGAVTAAGLARIGRPFAASPGPPDDDLSDLFEGPDMDQDNDVYIKDVVSVEEEDVFGEGGSDMSDILEVSDDDIMGEEDPLGYSSGSSTRPAPAATGRPTYRRTPPTGITGLRS